MAKFTRKRPGSKRAKPRHDDSLWLYPSGRRRKKLPKRVHYFGPADDPRRNSTWSLPAMSFGRSPGRISTNGAARGDGARHTPTSTPWSPTRIEACHVTCLRSSRPRPSRNGASQNGASSSRRLAGVVEPRPWPSWTGRWSIGPGSSAARTKN